MVSYMKAVQFMIEKIPEVNYARSEVMRELRDVYAQPLIRQCSKKLGSTDIKDNSDLKNYIVLIFEKSLELEVSTKELEKLESMRSKFPFLYYHGTKTDNLIHGFLYLFVALCNKNKKVIESLVSRWPVLDDQGNVLSLRRGLEWEYSKALREDVANLAKDCIKEFLQELRETGRVMTSAELAEHRQSLTSSDTTEEDDYSNDEFETETGSASVVTATRATNSQVEDSHSSDESEANADTSNKPAVEAGAASGSDGDKKIEASLSTADNEERAQSNNIVSTKTEDNSKPNTLLNHLLSWIYELPEWLQEQLLNSAPVKALIESAEQWDAIYDKKSVGELFAKLLSVDPVSNSVDATKDNINAKATISESTTESIDTSMILNEPTITGWILPTVAIGSDNLFGDAGFNGLVNFNGLDGLNVF